MSPHPSYNSPWPLQTPPPLAPPPTRPKRRPLPNDGDIQPVASTSRMLQSRQLFDPDSVGPAKLQCMNSGNDVISCLPTSSTVIPQHDWAAFVWNPRRPELTQTNKVNVFLFRADDRQMVVSFYNATNPTSEAGVVTARVNDTWFGERGSQWNGQNITYLFYWIITRSDKTLDGSEITQTTFTAVQTTYADFVLSSSSASAASAASASASEQASLSRLRPTASGLQAPSTSSTFPHWAIALIAILAFIALATFFMFSFFLLFRCRKSRRTQNRNSVGSTSPMIDNNENAQSSPLIATRAVSKQLSSSVGHHVTTVEGDGVSTISRSGSARDTGPFSGADAEIMADAFRQALRKPDFQTPEDDVESPVKDMMSVLAEQGMDLQSVGSSKGVTVQTAPQPQ